MVGLTAALVLAWTLTGQISAAKYSNDSGDLITRNYPKPLTWLDEITGGEPALYLGQNIERGRCPGTLADGVLEPLAEVRLEHRRHGAGTRAGTDARPRGH